MNRYDSMRSYVGFLTEAQTKIDELNRDYWKQGRDERIRRDVAKGSEIAARSFAAGALSVLIDLHIEDADYTPFDDQLGEDDVLEAVRRATSDEKDTGYWEYITRGGALSYTAWLRYEAERATIYAISEDDITDDQWKRLHTLDLALGY